MKTRKSFLKAVLTVMVSGLVLTSCEKKDTVPALSSDETILAQDEVFADATWEDVDAVVDDAILSLEQSGYVVEDLKSGDMNREQYRMRIDHADSTIFPKEITLDYGDGVEIIINGDTIIKAGIIHITITDRFWMPEAQRIITFENFTVNGILVEGTRIITNTGEQTMGKLQESIKLQDGKLTVNDTCVYTRNSLHLREFNRHQFADWTDDVVSIDVINMNGTNFNGKEYEKSSVEPLVLRRCENYRYRWTLVSGTMDCILDGNAYTFQYGNGTCDRDVTVTNGEGESRTFQYQNQHRFRNMVMNQGNN